VNRSLKHVDVGGDARHSRPRICVVESQVELLQVLHQLLAQVEHGKLAVYCIR